MNLILLGAPGAGKGTEVEFLKKDLSLPAISTGNILRAAIKNGTPIGIEAQAYITAGKLVPDDVIIGIVRERLAAEDCQNGFILDGMPRTIPQAQALEAAGVEIDAAVLMDVPDAVIEGRMVGRRTCVSCGATYHITTMPPKRPGICDVCGGALSIRKDDEPETVKERLRVYHTETEPLVGFYRSRGKLTCVNCTDTPEANHAAVMAALGISK